MDTLINNVRYGPKYKGLSGKFFDVVCSLKSGLFPDENGLETTIRNQASFVAVAGAFKPHDVGIT